MQACSSSRAAAPQQPFLARRGALRRVAKPTLARAEVPAAAAAGAASAAAAPVSASASPAPAAAPQPASGGGAAPKQLRLIFAAKNIPHPAKAHYGGEDAFFVSVDANACGIADGVGGWGEAGVNPADYSQHLMDAAKQYLEEVASSVDGGASDAAPSPLSSVEWLSRQPGAAEFAAAAERQARQAASASSSDESDGEFGGPRSPPPPLASVDDAPPAAAEALDVAHRSNRFPGSSTACVLRLDGARRVLEAANLGDSGFLVIRDGALHFQSPAMQHFFDCPLQFGMPPDTDWACDAAQFELEVLPGDAVVLATDGLLDNLYPADIVRLAPRSADQVEQAAEALAAAAAANAADPSFESPYTAEAREEGYDIPIWEKLMGASFKDGKLELGKLRGGKLDDVTVVCAYVAEA